MPIGAKSRNTMVFVRRKHTKGPNGPDNWRGAWMPQSEARQLHEEQLRNRARRAKAAGTSAPATAQASGTPVPIPAATTQTGGDTNAPAWWIPQAYTNPNDAQSFANVANALLPTLSPEDQRSMANYLANNFGDVYGAYKNATFTPIPTQLTNQRQEYLNPLRAGAALNLLNRMQQATGMDTTGAGYKYIADAVNLLNQYTSGGPMTREQFVQFSTALKNLQAGAGSSIGAYKNLGTLFANPAFSAGALVSNAPSERLNV